MALPQGPGATEPSEIEYAEFESGLESDLPRIATENVTENEAYQEMEDSDAETTFSVDSDLDRDKIDYIEIFASRLAQDIKQTAGLSEICNISSPDLSAALAAFAWNLHGESSTPFQWGICVTLRRMQQRIMNLIVGSRSVDEVAENDDSDMEAAEDGNDNHSHKPFQKSSEEVTNWLAGTEPPDIGHEEPKYPIDLDQFPDYEKFIIRSDAYPWLLSKIRQHHELAFQDRNEMAEVSTKTLKMLCSQAPLRQISRRKPSVVRMTFSLDWNPKQFVYDIGVMPPTGSVLDRILCLTGSPEQAQAMTIPDYIQQTWPVFGKYTLKLLRELLCAADGTPCHLPLPGSGATQLSALIRPPSSCSITVTGGPHIVSEIAEQIGWLSVAMRTTVGSESMVPCYPHVEDLIVTTESEWSFGSMASASCRIVSRFPDDGKTGDPNTGFCWGPLFPNTTLVRGYPILRRPDERLGLEVHLGAMATLTGSQQVVQWGERLIMKGFGLLLIATLATADVVVWHLLTSGSVSERISYVDPRLDTLNLKDTSGLSLRDLEGCRHVIGWCATATDFCGHRDASHKISTSGLRKPPSCVVIDRLYVEGGAEVVGGFSMSINKKPRPLRLEKEKDYPSLLRWIGLQPILFYDVSECRAWLADGFSALLHLVRASLHLAETDPESPYDWVFNPCQLKDDWEGCTGRDAARNTLKSWDNLNVNVYVKSNNGAGGKTYSTVEERVKKIMHCLEILVDAQAQAASQDGIQIPQTMDLRKGLVGYDFLDVVAALGPITPRLKTLDSWRQGWADLIPGIGATTIFGNGFGDIIRPDDPSKICTRWQSVPAGQNYMAASVSTLKMLYERRLQSIEPGLGMGEPELSAICE